MYASQSILSVTQKAENLVQFYNLDKNKDGKIDFDELVEGMQNTFDVDAQTATRSVQAIFAQSQKSHDNFIEYNQFVIATTFVRKEVCDKTLRKIFDELDTNKDEVISAQELKRCVEGVSFEGLLEEIGRK